MPKLDDLVELKGAGSMMMATQGSLISGTEKTETGYRKREKSSSKVSQAGPEKSSNWAKLGSTMTFGGGSDVDSTGKPARHTLSNLADS